MTGTLPAVAPPDAAAAPEPLLRVEKLSIRFGSVQANEDVSLDVFPGEVHCVLGENGAGKSTLMKMLYGVYRPDSGRILHEGRPVEIGSPLAARKLGLGMVFQDFRLVPALSVLENISLAVDSRGIRFRRRELAARFAEVAPSIGLDVDPNAAVRVLPIAQRQQVEIAKVLIAGAQILILDEPTSVLAPQEADGLFERMEELRARGLAVLLITHKLREIRQVADRITVLRGGRSVVESVLPDALDDAALVEAMVGRAVPPIPSDREAATETGTALELRGLCVPGDGGRAGVQELDLSVERGEVLGIAGVAGSGQLELADAVVGARAWTAGTVVVGGRELRGAAPGTARNAGVAAVPEDPVRQWVVRELNVLEQVANGQLKRRTARKWLVGIDWKRLRGVLRRLDEHAKLKLAAYDRIVATLSGGNIQRVVLTEALGTDASVYVLAYPTRGLDVASTRRVHELILERRSAGAGIVLISEDLDELRLVADRIAVLYAGRLAGICSNEAGTHEIGRLMVGVEPA